jgi:hypothetical protein
MLERASVLPGDAEVEFAHVLVGSERLGRAVEDDPAGFENIAEARIAQGDVRVLLGEKERDPFALTEVDRMLERAKEATRYGKYTSVEYARFADDMTDYSRCRVRLTSLPWVSRGSLSSLSVVCHRR